MAISEKKIIELLKNVSLFSKLKKEELIVVAKYCKEYSYLAGEIIFKQDSKAEELYIILEGEVLITKTSNKKDIDIARFISGECFGELDLLDKAPRTATAIAEKVTKVLIFPEKGTKFQDVLIKHPDLFARILHKLLSIIANRIRITNKLISEKTPWIEKLKNQVLKDKLTGLYNRSFLEEDFSEMLPSLGKITSLFFIKPDNFKDVNDTFGHEVGDNALIYLADKISSIVENDNMVIRYKGDEFVVILPEYEKDRAIETADLIRKTVGEDNIKNITKNKNFYIKLSIGISVYPIHSTDNIKLIKIAYNKMKEARNSGGDKILYAEKT